MSAVTEHATRRALPRERKSITHKFEIGQHEGYVAGGES